ncbi:MAG TPA: DUF692 family protein [Nannocystaceae bacterium]|nr:DUF692 family protein [Nannocystaceae bacterium]
MSVDVGLSLMLDDASRAAVLPLFEAGVVDALEWSFDIARRRDGEPEWAKELLDHYAAADKLWGHGVRLSPGSVDARARHDEWLARVHDECATRSYRGVSEHFGFMCAGDRDAGAPLPLPAGEGARRVLTRSLRRLADATGTAVGLENLALALGEADVWAQATLLRDVLADTDGYLVLDVHNLWCQLVNFALDRDRVLASYPLDRVRCIHVAGGTWWPIDGGVFRRDTHDDDVPDEVLALLATVVPRCPALELVVLERIAGSIRDASEGDRLRRDFARLKEMLA